MGHVLEGQYQDKYRSDSSVLTDASMQSEGNFLFLFISLSMGN